ncbi:unnamed protein product, partial [Haemonchus placei]|uniref:Ovule protein n=1 Tax=Haemonchus placei TaxID=6290 RepID=A0A0N4VVW1_HAEPC
IRNYTLVFPKLYRYSFCQRSGFWSFFSPCTYSPREVSFIHGYLHYFRNYISIACTLIKCIFGTTTRSFIKYLLCMCRYANIFRLRSTCNEKISFE